MIFLDKESKNAEKIETLIGEQCSITGNLNGGGVLKVDGSIDGDILWKDDVILGTLSTCSGNISCKSASIAGKVIGNIICEESLTIESSGKVTGDITIKKLIVKDGGTIDGRCTMVVRNSDVEVPE